MVNSEKGFAYSDLIDFNSGGESFSPEDLKLSTDTPSNIMEMTNEEILELVEDVPEELYKIPKKEKRIKFLETMFKGLGFSLENDLKLALLSENKRILILAPAGGGKTTGMTCKLTVEKIYRYYKGEPLKGENILCLVYNRDNVADFKLRHKETIERLVSSNLGGLGISETINCNTMHSFALNWLATFEYDYGMQIPKLNVEGNHKIMRDCVSVWFELNEDDLEELGVCEDKSKFKIDYDIVTSKILSLRTLMSETMKPIEELEGTDQFADIKLPKDAISEIISDYEMMLNSSNMMDYTTTLELFKKILDENPEIVARLHRLYRYVVVDEVQDFTPLFRHLLNKIVAEDVPLVCIGDDDQAIYGFRGSDTDTALKFKEFYPDGKIYTLSTNRRCPRNIVQAGIDIITLNKNRYPKQIKGIKGDGELNLMPYNTRIGQYTKVTNMLKAMSYEERANTVIACRETASTIILPHLLIENGISLHCSGGTIKPYSFPLYKAVEEVMKALYDGYSKRLLVKLHKILPVSKDRMEKVLGYNKDTDKFADGEIIALEKINFGKMEDRLMKDLQDVIAISKSMNSLPMKDYFAPMMDMIYRNYWKYIENNSKYPEYDLMHLQRIMDYFSDREETYVQRMIDYNSMKSRLESDQFRKEGVTISTFHTLKGLGFKNVIALDLDENIFPQTSRIQGKDISLEEQKREIETETRLFYVLITRTEERLFLFYPKDDPSVYIEYMKTKDYTPKDKKEKPDSVLNVVSKPNNINTATFTQQINNNKNTIKVVNNRKNLFSSLE